MIIAIDQWLCVANRDMLFQAFLPMAAQLSEESCAAIGWEADDIIIPC